MIEYKKPQKYLGPSQVATVLGYCKFETTEELKDKIEKGYSQTINPNVRLGIIHEPKCRSLYTHITGLSVKRAQFVVDPLCRHLGGIADGLVDSSGGLEIKCQFSEKNDPPIMHFSYKVQSVIYMYLYKREWWDILVCNIPNNRAIIERIYWKDYKDIWGKWYSQIQTFIDSIKWHYDTPMANSH